MNAHRDGARETQIWIYKKTQRDNGSYQVDTERFVRSKRTVARCPGSSQTFWKPCDTSPKKGEMESETEGWRRARGTERSRVS